MYPSKLAANPTRLVIHWTARVMSILFIAAFVMMFLRQGVPLHDMTPREWVSFFFFPLGAGLGMVLAWWLEGLGGAITVVSVLLSILIQDLSAGGAYALTCASPGLFFLFSWVLSLSATDPAEALSQRQPR
jgi:hypothetical protein